MDSRSLAATVAAYAEVVGRLAHRFADRAAVLAARGLDESTFGALEDEALAAIEASLRCGDHAAAASFADAVVRSRLALRGVDAPDPVTVAASTARGHAGFPAASAPVEAATAAPAGPPAAAPAPTDVLDFMETLHSTAGGRPRSST